MSRNVELESAIKYTTFNPTRYNGFLRVAANNFRLSTANQLFVYYQKEDADIVLDGGANQIGHSCARCINGADSRNCGKKDAAGFFSN